MTCPFGGIVLFAWTEVGSPPPPPGATLSCESGSRTFWCEVRHELAGVVQIRWTVNGGRVAGWDNKTYVSRGCTTGPIVAVQVTNSAGTATRQLERLPPGLLTLARCSGSGWLRPSPRAPRRCPPSAATPTPKGL